MGLSQIFLSKLLYALQILFVVSSMILETIDLVILL